MNDLVKSENVINVEGFHEYIFIHSSKQITYIDSKKFVQDIPKLFKNVPGVLLNVFDYKPNGFKSNLEFCETVKAKMDENGIQHYFSTVKSCAMSALFRATNIQIEFNETVLIIIVLLNEVQISEYEFTENGYKEMYEKEMKINIKGNPKNESQKILGSSNPKKIILMGNPNSKQLMKFLRTTLKSNKLIAFDSPPLSSKSDFEKITKWFLDRSFTKYFVIPKCARKYFLHVKDDEKVTSLLSFDKNEALPFTKVFVHKKSNANLIFGDSEDKKSTRSFSMKEKCHRNKITLTIDAENFITVQHEAFLFYKILDLPEKLNENIKTKIPIIGIVNELSVICTYKNDGYEFLDSWNGLYGKDLSIFFDQEKPIICDDAFLVPRQRFPFAVFDLIKIMSMPPEAIKIEEKWKFTILNDSENPVLLSFETFDGTKKAASPSFLMAMILKKQLKAIKKEIGQKPSEIGFCILDEFSEEERTRVENGLKESCEMLKMKCVFC